MKQAPVSTERDMKRVLQHVARSGFPARNRCLLVGFRMIALTLDVWHCSPGGRFFVT